MKSKLKALETQRLKLKYDILVQLSSFAFNFNLRRYNEGSFQDIDIRINSATANLQTFQIEAGRCRLTLSDPR